MTLSLDEVRNIRFPMARKPNEDGYRASSVDNFMDKLEISYAQLLEELEQSRAKAGERTDSRVDEFPEPLIRAPWRIDVRDIEESTGLRNDEGLYLLQ